MNPLTRILYIYIYIYIIFKQKIVLNPLNTNLHTFTVSMNQLKLRKNKEVQQKILVFNLKNKKPINKILKNHK